MKNILVILVVFAFLLPAIADIQAPPAQKYGQVRKLSRGLANFFYGASELPTTYQRTVELEGGSKAFSYGVINGVWRSAVRIGYGFYEVVTFPIPAVNNSYRPPFKDPEYLNVDGGYSEFPPDLGYTTSYSFLPR